MTMTADPTATSARSTGTSDEVSSDELVARAAALVPLLRENAQQSEQDRRVAQANIDALEEAGLLRLAKPKRFGGYEADFATFLRVGEELARGDGSTAWVTTLMNVCSWMVGLFPEQAQRDVFEADPEARVCGVLAPTATSTYAEGGLIVTGRWGFASGSAHAQWAGMGIPIVDAEGNVVDQGMALIPLSDMSLEDTWFVAGMKGTASNTLVAEEVFVPAHRIVSVPQLVVGERPNEQDGEALYRSALVPVLALVLSAPQVGLARHALEIVQGSLAKGRGISYTFYDKSRLAPTTQLQVSAAAQLIDTAHLHLMRAAGDIDAAALAGEHLDFLTRARVRADVGTIAHRTREAVDLLLNVHGAGSFAEANPMQRVWRDLETCSRHAVVNPEISAELYGRALLGVEEQITALI